MAALPMRVDTHAHCFLQSLPLAEGRRYAPGYDAPVIDYLSMLDANGLTHGVLVQPSFLGTDNSYLLSALRMAPKRLRGIVMLAPTAVAEDIARLSEAGIVGVRLNLIGKDDPELTAEPWSGHLRRLADAGWQVEVQVEAARLPRLLPPLLATGVTVVIDHFGRPHADLGIDDPGFLVLLAAGRCRQVWVKLSGSYRLGSDGPALARLAAAELYQAFGPTRLVWGSDWPHTQFESIVNPPAALAALDEWVPNPVMRARVLGASAAALFGFDAQPARAAHQSGQSATNSARAS